jgi:hypothetical protein
MPAQPHRILKLRAAKPWSLICHSLCAPGGGRQRLERILTNFGIKKRLERKKE